MGVGWVFKIVGSRDGVSTRSERDGNIRGRKFVGRAFAIMGGAGTSLDLAIRGDTATGKFDRVADWSDEKE